MRRCGPGGGRWSGMAEGEFRTLLEYAAEGAGSQGESGADGLQDAMVQDREIRELAEAIREAAPAPEPLLYSGT